MSDLKVIYFAGGNFWETQAYFSEIRGVMQVKAGYLNSKVPYPTYEQVCFGATGASFGVEIIYDQEQISLFSLATQFFKIIDPTSYLKQGRYEGEQYRTGIYYVNQADMIALLDVLSQEQQKYASTIVTAVAPLVAFYAAEETQQHYLKSHPQVECQLDYTSLNDLNLEVQKFISPKRFKMPSRKELREMLSPTEYAVTQLSQSDLKHESRYSETLQKGLYVDVITAAPLFSSSDKFIHPCGYPCFCKPLNDCVLSRRTDYSLNRYRIEVRSKTSNAHLGHVYTDGPEPYGLRYTINGSALRFINYERLDYLGYGEFMRLIH
ncbi:MAG: peptide-methionine (S)-S-oxide reductase MsrA [Succinivibrio sp.]|nr:peptide-methionine (S)-S-oxide reductase MsrA [Succinivibrio sp.]